MIPGAPLPGPGDLTALFHGAVPDSATLAAAWAPPGSRVEWFSRSAHSLAALAAGWRRRHGRQPRLWVPDYFCNASLDPVRRLGIHPTFYPVGLDLLPDLEECRRLASAPPDLFLAVHYFGQPGNMGAVLRFCNERGALLIEDCAHVLVPDSDMGRRGAFVLWSPHKHLAVPQGGLLVCQAPDEEIEPARGASPPIGGWLLKRLVQLLAPVWMLPSSFRRGSQKFEEDPAGGGPDDTPVLDDRVARLLAHAAVGLDRIGRIRRATAGAVLDRLMERAGWRPLFDPRGSVPYRLVMLCDDPATASERFDHYRCRGIPVESWPDMAPEVLAAPTVHARALDLRSRLLCFPVHQSIDPVRLLRRL